MKEPQLIDFIAAAGGVIAAILWPILLAAIRKDFPPQLQPGVPPWAWRYLRLLAFSVLTAFICVIAWVKMNPGKPLDWMAAFLLGFAWEAAIEKAFKAPLTLTSAPSRSSLWWAAIAVVAALGIALWALKGG